MIYLPTWILIVSVGKYTIHGWYGYVYVFCKYLGVTLACFGGNSSLTLILLIAGFVFNHSQDQWSPAESL